MEANESGRACEHGSVVASILQLPHRAGCMLPDSVTQDHAAHHLPIPCQKYLCAALAALPYMSALYGKLRDRF